MTESTEARGSLQTALDHARRLIDGSPALAAEQATEILKVVPGQPMATLLLGVARHRLGQLPESLAILEPLAREQARWGVAQYELGLALASAGRGERRGGGYEGASVHQCSPAAAHIVRLPTQPACGASK
jgi:hypothetical protein